MENLEAGLEHHIAYDERGATFQFSNQCMLQYMLTMYADICGHEISFKDWFWLI